MMLMEFCVKDFYPRKLDVVLESRVVRLKAEVIFEKRSDPEDVAGRALVSNDAYEA